MREARSTKPMGRRLRAAVVIVCVAIALPSLAHADGPPVFDPQVQFLTSSTYTNTPSSIAFRWGRTDNGADGTKPVVQGTYFAPRDWQFAWSSLRTADVSEGPFAGTPVDKKDGNGGYVTGHAPSCADVIVGEDSPEDQNTAFDNDDPNARDHAPANLGHAENLAGGIGMRMSADPSYDQQPEGSFSRVSVNYGYAGGNRPSLSFLNFDGNTANLCLYLWSSSAAISHYDNGTPGCRTADFIFAGANCSADDKHYESSREFIVPVTVTRMPTTDPNYSWRIDYSLAAVYRDQWLNGTEPATQRNHNVVLTELNLYLNDLAGGNWNINPVTGRSENVTFSKTPNIPGTYNFRSILYTCEASLDPVNVTGCANGNLVSDSHDGSIVVTRPPNNVVHDFGALTGPTDGGGALAGTGWAVIRGTTKVKISWTQPPVNPNAGIKGYELSVAVPGNNQRRHVEYVVTKDGDPNFDMRAPCGSLGTDASCSLTLDFAQGLNTMEVPLPKEGKYDVSLVTIYTDGTRTDYYRDGKCDNGQPLGTACNATATPPQVVAPGFSTWSFFITPTDYPMAFAEVASYQISGTKGPISKRAPFYLLLVNFNTRRGMYVITNPHGGNASIYQAASNQIVGDSSVGGGISFGSADVAGHQVNWRFDGAAPGALVLGHGVDGVFTLYDLKGAPALSGMPTGDVHQFAGATLS